jgi:cobalt-precorrin-5B (C1)-methyltransferase
MENLRPKNSTKSFFLLKESNEPEIGFTTGTCASAASVAAIRMLLTQQTVPYVILTTPKGIKVCIEIEDQTFSENSASCSVKKFSGTDPDITNGIKIFSSVKKIVTNFQRNEYSGEFKIEIDGGAGVGRVTLPGLRQKIGEAAINPVPREMIKNGIIAELKKTACKSSDFGIKVEITVPDGEEIARKTFNPKLGILGGISILGTSGIVEPMSEQALLDTIQLEMNVRKAQGYKILPLVPGNYGSEFMEKEFGFSLETAVHCSNFVYDAVKMAVKSGFRKMLFCGHIGKLVKVAGGIKNTHSKYGDHRMEIISEIAREFVPDDKFSFISSELMKCISTEQAINVLDSLDFSASVAEVKIRDKIMQEMAGRIQACMAAWAESKIEIEVVVFTIEHGLLAETSGARNFVNEMFGHDVRLN